MAVLGLPLFRRKTGSHRVSRGKIRCLLEALGLVLALCQPLILPAQTLRESQLKAAFVFNFAQFTEWPADAFASNNSPLIIGVLGSDSFSTILAETVHNETVQGHPLKAEHYRTLAELKNCHILFISTTESAHLEAVLNAVKDKPVLTVSEIDRAAYRGTMIRMFNKNNRIQLRINVGAARAARLTLSSKLLRVAAEIIPSSQDEK